MGRHLVQAEESGGEGDAGLGEPAGFHALVKNPDLQSWAQQRGWKDPDAVVESFRNAEKLLGAPKDRLLVLPDREDAPEWGAVYSRLGKPESADKYDIQLQGAYDEGFLNWFRGIAHESNLSNAAAGKIASGWETYIDAMVAEQSAEADARMQAEMAQLRSEWGSQFDANFAASEQAAQKLGLTKDQFGALEQALGPLASRKLFGIVASKVLEPGDPIGAKGGSGWAGTPEAARMKLRSMEQDSAFMAKYASGDRGALEQYTEAMKAAYPDEG